MLAKPLNPMVLLIIIPMKNGYFIGNINPTVSDKPILTQAGFKWKCASHPVPVTAGLWFRPKDSQGCPGADLCGRCHPSKWYLDSTLKFNGCYSNTMGLNESTIWTIFIDFKRVTQLISARKPACHPLTEVPTLNCNSYSMIILIKPYETTYGRLNMYEILKPLTTMDFGHCSSPKRPNFFSKSAASVSMTCSDLAVEGRGFLDVHPMHPRQDRKWAIRLFKHAVPSGNDSHSYWKWP